MSEENRGTLTIGLWFLSAIVLAALFIASGAQGELTTAHIVFASVLLALATVGTITIWSMKGSAAEAEKTKGRRLDSVFSNLSDDELAELKYRMAALDADKPDILDYLSDDGELRQRR